LPVGAEKNYEKISISIATVLTKIWNRNIPNKSLEFYRYIYLLGEMRKNYYYDELICLQQTVMTLAFPGNRKTPFLLCTGHTTKLPRN
jgi:hypothetical protein